MKNDIERSRYEMDFEGQVVYADYRLQGNVISITHVFTPEELRGQGAAGKLMQGIAEEAKENNLLIRPICPYAGAWLKKHKDFSDLVV